MSNGVNPPDSPPVPAEDTSQGIPEGLATKIGKYGFVVYALLALLVEVFDLNISTETMLLLAAALVPPTVTQVGRYAQAKAIYESEGSEDEEFIDDFPVSEPDVPDEVPSEEALKTEFPEDAPVDGPPEGAVGGKAGE